MILEITLSSAAVARGFASYVATLFGLDPSALRIQLGPVALDPAAAALVLALTALLAGGTAVSSRFNMGALVDRRRRSAGRLLGGWAGARAGWPMWTRSQLRPACAPGALLLGNAAWLPPSHTRARTHRCLPPPVPGPLSCSGVRPQHRVHRVRAVRRPAAGPGRQPVALRAVRRRRRVCGRLRRLLRLCGLRLRCAAAAVLSRHPRVLARGRLHAGTAPRQAASLARPPTRPPTHPAPRHACPLSVANAAEEAKDPARDLPWGIVGSLGIATVL